MTVTTADAAGAGFFGALGIGVVNTAAFVAGVASVPTPLTELEWPGWLFHSFFDIRSNTATIADGVNQLSQQMVIDSKAMRKWGNDETLMAIVEVVESTNAALEIQADTRILLKLH